MEKEETEENNQNEQFDNPLVPFEPDFEEDVVSDIDLISALCEVEPQNQNSVTTNSTAISNRIMNNLPQSMFANCSHVSIGTINFNITK